MFTESRKYENFLQLVVKPTPDNDPLGISEVSGFYGPGTWIGFNLTIITAWYNAKRKPRSRWVQDVVLMILATNWAAVDLLRHTVKHRNDIEQSYHSQAATAAAVLGTYWGLECALLQLTAIPDKLETMNLTLRGVLLRVGSLLPAIALASIFHQIRPVLRAGAQPERPRPWEDTLPVMYFPKMGSIVHAYVIWGIATLGLYATFYLSTQIGLIIFFSIRSKYRNRSRPGDEANSDQTQEDVNHDQTEEYDAQDRIEEGTNQDQPGDIATLFEIGSVLLSSLIFALLSVDRTTNLLRYIGGFFIGIFVVAFTWVIPMLGPLLAPFVLLLTPFYQEERCFFMPCAPQSLNDWDQMFALLVGLVMFIYDMAPAMGIGIFWWIRYKLGLFKRHSRT